MKHIFLTWYEANVNHASIVVDLTTKIGPTKKHAMKTLKVLQIIEVKIPKNDKVR